MQATPHALRRNYDNYQVNDRDDQQHEDSKLKGKGPDCYNSYLWIT